LAEGEFVKSNQALLIGAGQLGSRHLQALKNVKRPLDILVVDPDTSALGLSRKRYEEINGAGNSAVRFEKELRRALPNVDVAIIATNSNARFEAARGLLEMTEVRYMILEKLLFNKREQYSMMLELLAQTGTRAYVNCSMRTMPFYSNLKGYYSRGRVSMSVNGGDYGLVTNLIHYVDYIELLSGCHEFSCSTEGLEKRVYASRRKGFVELNGVFEVFFSDGSHGSFTCYSDGKAPVLIEVMSPTDRHVIREGEKKAWAANETGGWAWKEESIDIPYQSEMTTGLVDQLLEEGKCPLVRYEQSMNTHLRLLSALASFLEGSCGVRSEVFPFT
jgi:predicted dehydrogenase